MTGDTLSGGTNSRRRDLDPTPATPWQSKPPAPVLESLVDKFQAAVEMLENEETREIQPGSRQKRYDAARANLLAALIGEPPAPFSTACICNRLDVPGLYPNCPTHGNQAPTQPPAPTDESYMRAYPPNPVAPPAPHQLPDLGRLAMAMYLSQTAFGQATNPGKWESYDLNRKDFWNYVAFRALAAYRRAAPVSPGEPPPRFSAQDFADLEASKAELAEIVESVSDLLVEAPGEPPAAQEAENLLHDMAAYKTKLEGKLAQIHSLCAQANSRKELYWADAILKIIEGEAAGDRPLVPAQTTERKES